MVYNPLLVIDWKVVSLDDPVYKGVADGNVVITKTGSISLTVKAPAAGSLTALQVAADAKAVTIATSISVVAARETVSALKFADGNTDFNGTVNFGANPVQIVAASTGMTGSSVRVIGIAGADLAFANPAELSALGGSLTATAAPATGAAVARGIDAAVVTFQTALATNFTVTATGGKNQTDNDAEAIAVNGSELRFKTLLAGAKFTVNAVGGKNGVTACAAAGGMVSALADIEITQQLDGTFKVTATGGTGSGVAGAEAVALDSARDIAVGETLNSLRITVSATGGQGSDSRADSAAFRAADAFDIDGALYASWTISATGGKGVNDAGAAATAIKAGALAVGGLLSGSLSVTARGGSGAVNAEAETAGFDAAGGNVDLTISDAAFRMTLQAYGGSATGSADAAATGITAGNLVFAGNAAGNYTLSANAGTGSSSAKAAVSGWNAGAVDGGGSLSGNWVLNASGGRGNADVRATVTAIAAAAIEFNELAAAFTVNARGGSGANAEADGRVLSGGTIRIVNGLIGNWTINVTGGQNIATLGTSTAACAAAIAATGDLTVGGAFAGNFNLTSRGGNWGDGHAKVHALDAAGAVSLGNFIAGARFFLSATGGTNGADLSAAAVAIRGDTISTGNWIGSHSVTVSAGNGSADASAYGAMLEATGGDAILGMLTGSLALNVRGGSNGVSNRAAADALKAAGELRIAAIDKSFVATLNATSGGTGVDSLARSIVLTGSSITVSGEFAGTFTVNASGGKTRTGAVASTSSAVGAAASTAGGKITIASFGQTTVTVNVKGGSDAISNDADANGFYGGTGLEAGAIGSNFRLTVTANAGNGAKVGVASSENVSANAVGRAFATDSGELKLTGGFAGTLSVTATAGVVNGGDDTSATATAHAFYAGVNTAGQLAIAGTITGNITVKAVANNFSQVGDAALAIGFAASGAISLGEFGSAFRLTVNAASIGNAAGRAIRSGDTLAIERLDGSWTVSAKGGGTDSSGCAAAHAFSASRAIAVAALATTLKVTLSATGGNATMTGNAFTDSRVFYSIGGAVSLTSVAGTFAVTTVSSKAIEDSYSRGYFISSLGVTTGDFDRGFKLQISTRGGTSYKGDANAESYGIFSGIGSIAVGTLAGTFELAATGGVGSAAAISSTPQKVAAGSAAANAIALAGKGITLNSIDASLKMKLTSKAGVSAVSNRTKTASAESRGIQSKDGNLTVTGKIGGAFELAASGGVAAAGSANPTKIEPGYNEYAAANATATLASGNAVSLGNFEPALKFIALATAGSASSEALAQTIYNAQSESTANAVAAAVTADNGNLFISRLNGNFTMASRAGSASASAVSSATAIDMNAVAIAAANASGTGFSGNSVTFNQVDPGLRIVISAAAGKATATASKLFNDKDEIEDSGTATATASAYATASGIRAESGNLSVANNLFGGLIAVTAIGGSATTNGQAVTGDAVAGKSYGIYSAGAIYGADAAHALVIAKVIAAAANTEAYAICGNGLNLTVNGALYAGYHTNAATVADALAKLVGTGNSAAKYLADALKLDGKAYAVKGGDADDIVAFGSGSIAIGNIDLGGGSNTLSLTHQSQLCGDILASDGGSLNLIINLGGDSSANPLITVGSDAGKNLGGASVSIQIGAAQLGSYILVKNGGDFAANTFTVNGRSLAVGHEIRLDNGTYVSLHIDSKKQLIFTAGAGHNPNAASDSQLFGTPSADPAARQLLGGAGDDLHLVRNSGDTVAENAASGTDTAVAGVSYILGDNLENLFLHGRGDLDATGNADANRIAGNAGNNILDGGGGDDTFIFSENWGHDLVRNDGGAIELLFTDGLRADDLTFDADGDDLVVTAKLTGDTIRVEDWALNAANSIRFGDDLYFDNYLLRSQLGCFATLETLSEQSSTKNASLAS